MSKFIPGPWKVEKEDHDYLAIYANSILIADVLDTYGGISKANAQAIAALPELYEALKTAIELLQAAKYTAVVLNPLEAVLAKVEGETV